MQLIRIILNIISYWPDLVALIVKVKVIATDIRQLHIYTIRLEKERERAREQEEERMFLWRPTEISSSCPTDNCRM